MILLNEKLEKRTRELEAFRFVSMESLEKFEAMEGQNDKDTVYDRMPEEIKGYEMKIGDEFVGYDRYLWLEKKVTLPETAEGMEVAGVFDFGKTGGGHNSGFESLLYVNGEPYQGVDTNHNDVIFERFAGQEVTLTFMLWTGLNGGARRDLLYHRIKKADIGYLHKATDEFYYFSKAIYKTLNLLADEEPMKQELGFALNNAYKLINWDRDKFYDSVSEALAYLLKKLDQLEKSSPVTVHCVGHTHIDVAWLWRLKHTREKAIRSFSTVMRLMDEFDDYIFLQSQPQLYEYMKTDNPELYENIKDRVKEGKWEPDGGMWLEADCNISSGESLTRQFLHGINFMKDEFGHTCEYLWLPDVFGYSWALPQILKQCNINTFATTKISWNQFNTMPHDLFWWRGIDGSEVMTYFINTPEEGHPETSRYATYNGQLSPRSVLGSWRKFKDKEISRDTLISYGYGDGGGGVNRNMLKMRRVMDKLPGLPNVKNNKAGTFFEKTRANLEAAGSEAAVWDGELYLEYHRGTYTSQAHNKKMNRFLEFALAQTEWLSQLSELQGGAYEQETLYLAWQCVLRNQFHDIIPGSSIQEVYEDSTLEYAKAWSDQEEVRARALENIVETGEGYVALYNFASFPRKEAVFVPCEGVLHFTDTEGKALEAQKVEGGYLVSVELAPLSVKNICMEAVDTAEEAVFAVDETQRVIDTPVYRIVWNEAGFLSSIYDKENDREVLKENGLGNVLEIFEDKPLNYDNWDIDIFYTEKRETAALSGPVSVIENGNLRAKVRFTYSYNKSQIVQDLIVYKDSRRIDFETYVNWHEECRLLKTAFEADIRSSKATFDIQYGHAERPTHFNTSWDYARFEVVGHKWADLSESNYGVSLLNNCKFGYNIKDNVIKLSLLKSTKVPDAQMDMGEHRFTYSLLPHAGSVTEGNTIEEANFLNLPVQAIAGKSVVSEESMFKFTDKTGEISRDVVIDAVKKAEKEACTVLRFHECRGGSSKVKVSSSYPVKKYVESNLLEENCGQEAEEQTMEFILKPFEIKTVKIWF